MTGQSWQVGGDSYAQDFTYNSSDGSLNTFAISRNGSELTKFTMEYDGLRRLSSMNSSIFNRKYAYRDISGTQTTTQIQSVEYTKAPFGNPYTFAKYSYTYYVASGVLVHNSCNHNSKWNLERRNYWRNSAKTVTEGKNYGAYTATAKNIERMGKGLAPVGWDGKSVQLHYWVGIAKDFYNYSPVSRTLHQLIHMRK